MSEDLLDVVGDHDVAEVRGQAVRVRVERPLQDMQVLVRIFFKLMVSYHKLEI